MTVVLVKVSVYQVIHSNKHACDSSLSKHPLIRCIASPAGSEDTGEESFIWMGLMVCNSCMQRLWGFRSRSLGGASSIPPPGNSNHCVSRRSR